MIQETTISSLEISFKDFLFKNKRNRTILWLAAIAIIIQFAIFKYFYPFASYIHGDSFSYLNAAFYNLRINTYMIGYSQFLRLFSVFSSSDFALTSFQYLFIESSGLFLLFTLYYFYKPTTIIRYILVLLIVFNPLFLHLSNLISSDCFFAALSLNWFGLLLWIIHKPSTKIIIIHTLVLMIVFTVRYNALIYPFISIFAFTLSKLSTKYKIIGALSGLTMCGLFVFYTSFNYYRLTGIWQYSPFSGWQFANNAMYTYRYVKSSERQKVPKKYENLDNMIRSYFDSTRNTNKFPIEKIKASTYYMWSRGLPLMKYKDSLFKKDKSAQELKKWASMGPFYKSYGLYIIQHYPLKFLKYYIWPNAQKYYAPPIEFLKSYNTSNDSVALIAKDWFKYKSSEVKTRMKNREVWILDFYPILSGIINVVMLLGLISYLSLKGWKFNTTFTKIILLGSSIWLLNAFFTIVASSAALRFQSFPIILSTIFSFLLIDWMVQLISISKAIEDNIKYKASASSLLSQSDVSPKALV